jgi:hypothetical protein
MGAGGGEKVEGGRRWRRGEGGTREMALGPGSATYKLLTAFIPTIRSQMPPTTKGQNISIDIQRRNCGVVIASSTCL